MRHEKLFEPVDAAEPCGPDLDEIGDDDYLNYVLPAEDRLPVRFFDKDSGAPFDRTTIDLRTEVKTIAELLDKSRDLRLLTLEARFQVLAGQIIGFSECIQAISGLVSRYWEHIHPVGYQGDFTLRQNTLASLDDRIKIILPLQFASIVRDKKLGNIAYRHYALATGQVQPRGEEQILAPNVILDALGSADNQALVEAVHASLVEARASLASTRAAFIDAVGHGSAPSFEGLTEAIGQIVDLIEKARPTLSSAPPAAEPEAYGADASAQAGQSNGVAAVAAQPPRAPDLPAVAVGTQDEARAALLVAEEYFSRQEPSAPALILVRQARLLIGQPLVAALEALIPQTAETALIRFDDSFKFQIEMSRMRILSEEEPRPSAGKGIVKAGYTATSRAEAAALIAGVEAYFRTAEPSSPVPMLLAKARGVLNRDFLAILKDLIGVETQGV